MSALNKRASVATGFNRDAYQELRRAVMSCFLWEDQFYENGVSIAQRIEELSAKVNVEKVAELAVEARNEHNLRHVSLLLLLSVIKNGRGRSDGLVSDTIEKVVQRADEMPELLAMYWKDGKRPLAKQLKLGLAAAMRKFSAYNLAKYNRDAVIKLRDVLFLVHPKAKDEAQQKTWDQLVAGTLPAPDTWEVALSSGKDKKSTWESMLAEGTLGHFALLRNLRNMAEVKVNKDMIKEAILARKGGAEKILPFRYVAAARAAPMFEKELDISLQECIKQLPELKGNTVVLVDVSGSMLWSKVSAKSDMSRMDAAATLASVINAESLRVFTFSYKTVEVPARRGMSGVDAVVNSQKHGGTNMAAAVSKINNMDDVDRLIVITDEQSTDGKVPAPVCKNAYLINVASYQNGLDFGKWTRINGFSEHVIHWIHEHEKEQQ